MQIEIPLQIFVIFICLVISVILYKKKMLGDALALIFFGAIFSALPITMLVICMETITLSNHKFLTFEEKRYITWKEKMLFKTVPYSEIKRRIKQAEEDRVNEEKIYKGS